MSLRSESPIIYSKALAKIDDTIARSQQAMNAGKDFGRQQRQQPIDLPELLLEDEMQDEEESDVERSEDSLTQKPDADEAPLSFAPRPPNDSILRLKREKDALESQIRELGSRLKTEEYLKSSYEKTVKELRDRIKELEELDDHRDEQKREIRTVSQAIKAERSSKAVLSSREEALLQRIDEQDRRIRELERTLRNQSVQGESGYAQQVEELKATIDRLTKENQRLEGRASAQAESRGDTPSLRTSPEASQTSLRRVDLLEKKLDAIDAKYRSQMEVNEELQRQIQCFSTQTPVDFTKSENATLIRFEEKMKRNTDKIEMLEEKVRRTTGMYEDLRVMIARSPTAGLRDEESPDRDERSTPRKLKPKTKKTEPKKGKTRPATAKPSKPHK